MSSKNVKIAQPYAEAFLELSKTNNSKIIITNGKVPFLIE